MSSSNFKRPTRSLNAIEKLKAITRVSVNGETKASVARSLGVPESTLRGWCKNQDKIRNQVRMLCPTEENSNHGEDKNVPKRFNLAYRPITYASAVEKPDQIYQYQENLHQQACHSYQQLIIRQELTRERETITENDHPKNVQNHGSVLDTLPVIQNHLNQIPIGSVDIVDPMEAMEHGNQFLRWLEECSNPAVTTVQVKTVQTLMKNLQNAFEQRSQSNSKVKK